MHKLTVSSGPEAPSHAGMCQPMIMSGESFTFAVESTHGLVVIEDMWILGGTFLVNVSPLLKQARMTNPLQVFHSVNPQTGEVTMWDLDA